jgi:hypothetical protein
MNNLTRLELHKVAAAAAATAGTLESGKNFN